MRDLHSLIDRYQEMSTYEAHWSIQVRGPHGLVDGASTSMYAHFTCGACIVQLSSKWVFSFAPAGMHSNDISTLTSSTICIGDARMFISGLVGVTGRLAQWIPGLLLTPEDLPTKSIHICTSDTESIIDDCMGKEFIIGVCETGTIQRYVYKNREFLVDAHIVNEIVA